MAVVFVTGAAGFLGRHISRHFFREDWRVVGLDDVPPENAPVGALSRFVRMKLPSPELGQLLAEESPKVCVHCAGRASVPLSMKDPAGDFRDNVGLTFELLEALRQNAPGCRAILLSSAAVYGNPSSLPVDESAPVAPLSPYGWHKRQCELLMEEFCRVYSVPAVSLRIFSAYGPGLRRQVIWDICERALTTGKLELRGTGAESRDFVHATDIARAVALAATAAPARGEVYNLASGAETTIAELAATLIDALGLKLQPAFDGKRSPGEPLRWQADLQRISSLGFTPKMALDHGLREVAAWASAELAS